MIRDPIATLITPDEQIHEEGIVITCLFTTYLALGPSAKLKREGALFSCPATAMFALTP